MAIKHCTCKHPYQDEKYGKHKRVYNPMKNEGMYRCTVCSNETTAKFK